MAQTASELSEDAAEWVARMDADVWTDDDEAALAVWLANDPRRRGALLQAQAAWMTFDKPIPTATAGSSSVDRHLFSRRHLVVGSGVALSASLVGWLVWPGSATSYTTQIGEIRRVPMADGSTAAINTASQVDIGLADTVREVRIERGEAWFQVTKDPRRPFIVEAGNVRVRAVGTAFSVRRFDTGADVLVTEGIVEAWAAGAEGHRVTLAAGHRAFVGDNSAIVPQPTPPSSLDRTLAWRSGNIDLFGEPLSDAIAEFNRYNHRQIVLVDRALAGELFDGVFRTDDPAGFALAVKSSLDVPVDLSDPDLIRIGHPET